MIKQFLKPKRREIWHLPSFPSFSVTPYHSEGVDQKYQSPDRGRDLPVLSRGRMVAEGRSRDQNPDHMADTDHNPGLGQDRSVDKGHNPARKDLPVIVQAGIGIFACSEDKLFQEASVCPYDCFPP